MKPMMTNLETWEARRIDKILNSGRTHPLVVDCVRMEAGVRSRRYFILKTMALPEIKETSLGFEILGNLLARSMGVNTPEPVLVRISPEFANASQTVLQNHSYLSQRGAKLLPGMGAGCEYLSPGFTTIVPDTYLSEEDLLQATRIYAFDMMVQNPDRSFDVKQRPNCAHFDKRLVAYDFELAFSFVYLFGNTDPAWEVTRHGLSSKHLFYRHMRAGMANRKIDMRPIIEDIEAINVDNLMLIAHDMPTGWMVHASKIESHLREIVTNARKFETELYRSLA